MFFFLPLSLIVMKIIHICAFLIDTEYKNYICNPYELSYIVHLI